MTTLNQADYPISIEHLKKLGYEPVVEGGKWAYRIPKNNEKFVSAIYERDFPCTLNQKRYIVRAIPKEKKLRPWKPEEVPVGALARLLSWTSIIASVTEKGINLVGHEHVQFREFNDLSSFEHSTDNGKTWKPCGVEEEV